MSEQLSDTLTERLQQGGQPRPGEVVFVNIGVAEEILRPAIVIRMLGPAETGQTEPMLEVVPYLASIDYPLAATIRLRGQDPMRTSAAPTLLVARGDGIGEWRAPEYD